MLITKSNGTYCTSPMIIVFLSPESLQLPTWMDNVSNNVSNNVFKARLALVAVETHCIAEWSVGSTCRAIQMCSYFRGKDFWTDFNRIGGLRALTNVPFMALTASAPDEVEATIISSLQLNSPVIVHCDLDRPNIYFSVSSIKTLNVSDHLELIV